MPCQQTCKKLPVSASESRPLWAKKLRFYFLQPSVADLTFPNTQDKNSALTRDCESKILERREILFEVPLIKFQRQIFPNTDRVVFGLFLR